MTNKYEPNAAKACADCPWRISNQGRPHPENWYGMENLDRLWDGLRSGQGPGMTCHPTDPEMAEFKGYERTAESKHTFECAGAVTIMLREVMRFQALARELPEGQDALRAYKRAAPRGMSREALFAIALRAVVPTNSFTGGHLNAAVEINDPDVGCPRLPPWEPAILDRARGPRSEP